MVGFIPLKIQEIRFSGEHTHILTSDDAQTDYEAPQWLDGNGDGEATTNTSTGDKNYPVAFSRFTKPTVGAQFKVPGFPAGQSVKIKANSSEGLRIPETTVTSEADGIVTLPATPASDDLAELIQFYNASDVTAFEIDWEISLEDGPWTDLGSTSHTVYVKVQIKPIYQPPAGSGLFTNMLIKNWAFNQSHSVPAEGSPFTHFNSEFTLAAGIPGQSNVHPSQQSFGVHFIVRHNGRFFDPSYGTTSTTSKQEWQNGAIYGYSSWIPLTIEANSIPTYVAKENNPNSLEVEFTPP